MRTIAPRGFLHSFEFNDIRAARAQEEFEENGLGKWGLFVADLFRHSWLGIQECAVANERCIEQCSLDCSSLRWRLLDCVLPRSGKYGGWLRCRVDAMACRLLRSRVWRSCSGHVQCARLTGTAWLSRLRTCLKPHFGDVMVLPCSHEVGAPSLWRQPSRVLDIWSGSVLPQAYTTPRQVLSKPFLQVVL